MAAADSYRPEASPSPTCWSNRHAVAIERRAELLYHDAKNGLDYTIAKRAEEQSRSSRRMELAAHRLNVLAAFFFPVATLSAVFGVNISHGLENLPPPLPFLGVLLAGLACGGLLTLYVTSTPDKKAAHKTPRKTLSQKYSIGGPGAKTSRFS